jgi:hypothetical protein
MSFEQGGDFAKVAHDRAVHDPGLEHSVDPVQAHGSLLQEAHSVFLQCDWPD